MPSLPALVLSSLLQFALLFSATFATATSVPRRRENPQSGVAAWGCRVLHADLFISPRLAVGRVLRAGLLAGLAMTAVSAVLATAIGFVTEAAGREVELQQIVDIFQRSAWPAKAVIFTSSTLCSPIFEELFFRYALESVITGATGNANRALVYTAIIFAAMHGNLAAMPSLMAVSVGCSLVYRRMGNLAAPIAAHFLFNLVSITVILCGGAG